ncbi:MAG: hypothetical protein R3230_05475 [Nitrosopumilaceae archaeon]|nr:hypothetical protein [Nitrosopumilaceae archaeon]
MDEKLKEIINKKINEVLENTNEIQSIIQSLKVLSADQNSFAYGIIIGRLYNSFHYQCRRILKRNPTDEEFSEFLEILKKQESKFLNF